jgi:penicillin-binding protein 1C
MDEIGYRVMKRFRKSIWLIALLVLVLLGSAGFSAWLLIDLPTLDRLTTDLVVPSTQILARDGRLLYQITDPAGQNHITVLFEEIPNACRQAMVATEDATFYQNSGVELTGVFRALWINLQGGETLAGGSTITQQVARNTLLDPQERAQRSLRRKLRESILAWRLTQTYSKDTILALYLNQTYFGNLAYGIAVASQTYFGKPVQQLSLAECALLAGLPQAPSLYDPFTQPAAAKDRQQVVLGLMEKAGYLSIADREVASQQSLQYATTAFPIQAPHFALWVWQQLERRYPPEVLYSGLTVTTTLDLDLTALATRQIQQQLALLQDTQQGTMHNATDGALVALDPQSGQILAMVGSPNYFDVQISGAINMAVSPRQPGSALKPFVYATALDPNRCAEWAHPSTCPWTAATMLLDVRHNFLTHEGLSYVPQNYDRAFHGPVLLRSALGGSLNVPAVLAMDAIGVSSLLRLTTALGMESLRDAERFGLALSLGGGEVSLLELTAAYGVLANRGQKVPVSPILEVRTAAGTVLESWQTSVPQAVIPEQVAYLVTDILADNKARLATFGEHSLLNIGRPAAVKTGTTTDWRDNWTVGYTPELVVGVWVGNADFTPMRQVSGITGAAPIWHHFMRQALAGKPERLFVQPAGFERVAICELSGKLPTPLCPHTTSELFIAGTAPTTLDDFYQQVNVDRLTGFLADDSTPPERRQVQTIVVLPALAQAWGAANGIPLPPAAARVDVPQLDLQLTSPDDGTIYRISPRLPSDQQRIRFRIASPLTLRNVSFWLNGQPYRTLSQAPWVTEWQLQVGEFQLQVFAQTADGQQVQSNELGFTVLPPD